MEQEKNRTFRDKISYVSEQGRRVWIYAKRPAGKLYNYRMLLGYFLITIFYIVPYVKVNGNPLFLVNFIERKFILFSKIFWPQDSYILFVTMISFFIFIILFTAIYGRVWCGWACPQSVFMELVFRNIEYLIEGSPAEQRKIDAENLTFKKIFQKTLKHLIFWIIAFSMGFTLFAYLMGIEKLLSIFYGTLLISKTTVVVLFVFSTVIYLVFAKLRELTCTIVCPYGRLQGVLLDKNSMAVSYDFKRGEPRGNNSKDGDCIDCKSCVQVCQQGVDIRNGIQLECTNCSACIDACNKIMLKQNKPKGLIRYASLNNIENGTNFKMTPRIIIYSTVLVLLLSFLITLLATRKDIQTTILRTPGTLAFQQEDGTVGNLYNIKIINKTHNQISVTLKLISPSGNIVVAGNQQLIVKDQELTEAVFFVNLSKDIVQEKDLEIEIAIYAGEELLETKKNTFKGK